MSEDNMLEDNKSEINEKMKQRESVVTFTGSLNDENVSDMALMWQNLTYYKTSYSSKQNTSKPILWQLKGQINFGTLNALMGPSGAGKTTLLRCINGMDMNRLSPNTEIYVNKHKPLYTCFIAQDVKEHLLMSLTVRESLKYAILLKNRARRNSNSKITANRRGSRRMSLYDIYDNSSYIDKLMIDLMLTDCANNRVMRCSGGEQKRLVIGLELTEQIKPNLICIDEPTSGLDSNTAEQTMVCLQKLAHKHSLAIVTSIHQPNSDVLMLFDKLYVLAKGGHCVYFGAPIHLKRHLTECQIQCLEHQTPIEVLLKVASNFNIDTNNLVKSYDISRDPNLMDKITKIS